MVNILDPQRSTFLSSLLKCELIGTMNKNNTFAPIVISSMLKPGFCRIETVGLFCSHQQAVASNGNNPVRNVIFNMKIFFILFYICDDVTKAEKTRFFFRNNHDFEVINCQKYMQKKINLGCGRGIRWGFP